MDPLILSLSTLENCYRVVISEDGTKALILKSRGGVVELWDLETGKKLKTINTSLSDTHDVVFIPHTDKLRFAVSGSYCCEIYDDTVKTGVGFPLNMSS